MSDHLTYHTRFSPDEFELQYNLRLGRPDYEETVIPDWIHRSEQARESLSSTLDVRYGEGEKQKLDVFTCGDTSAPTLIYFHGGYWQRGDKSIYSYLAVPFTAAGVNVVVAGYDLCPDVSITQISQQAREAIVFVYQNSERHALNAQRITVMGHSAGGHITQMMMGTAWREFDLPADTIKAGIPVSPLSFLEPVRLTAGLNSGIRMDEEEARLQSPMLHHQPVTDSPQLVVVGGAETDEFHRQASMYVDAFGSADRLIEQYVVPDVDHFDELNVLASADSEFFQKSLALINLK